MAYVSNIPQPTDQLSVSQPQILGNFTAINNWVGVNHVGFNLGDSGKHTFVTLTDQTGTPNPFMLFEVGLYNKVDPVTTFNQLFVSYKNSAGMRFNYPITASIITNNTAPGFASNGWAYLPSGVIVKWGQQSGVPSGASTITFPVSATIPVFTQVFQVLITGYKGAADNNPTFLQSLSLVTGFQVNNTSASATTVCYLAIGY